MNNERKTDEDLLRERREEDDMFQRATRNACWETLHQLREDRRRIWSEILEQHPSENVPDAERFNAVWEEEVERTRNMLETMYNNLQMTSGTNVYKKTVVLKDEQGQPTMEISSVVMTHKLKPSVVEESRIEISHSITNKQMSSRYKIDDREYNDDDENNERTIVVENRKAECKRLIDRFAVIAEPTAGKADEPKKSSPKLYTRLIGNQTTKKPTIRSVEIVKTKDVAKTTTGTQASKRKKSAFSESAEDGGTSDKKRKALRRDESRQSPLEGVMKPEERSPSNKSSTGASPTGSTGSHTPVRMTMDTVEIRTGPSGKKMPVIRLKRTEQTADGEAEPVPGPSWRE